MKYLTMSSDYASSGIKDDFGREIQRRDLPVEDVLWERLSEWLEKYNKIIMMEAQERKENINLINRLDNEGMQLARDFKNNLGSEYKIRYYSEGLLKYLS